MNESALVEAAVGGDEEAFAALAETYRPVALRIARQVLDDAEAAEDVAQDLLLRLDSALPGFRGESELGTWVYRVVLNLCRDRLRVRRGRAAEVDLAIVSDSVALATEARADSVVDSERARAAVREAVARLPDAQREAIVLRYMADLPYEEIARVTAVPVGTVASRVFRGLERLGKDLEPRLVEVLK